MRSQNRQNIQMVALLCLLLVALLGLAWFIGLRIRARKARLSAAAEGPNYHAVAVVTGDHPCAAIQRIFGRRYISGAAPIFPLPDCDQAACACRYEHHADRRNGGDRRDIWVAAGPKQVVVEAGATPRVAKDRRSNQLSAEV